MDDMSLNEVDFRVRPYHTYEMLHNMGRPFRFSYSGSTEGMWLLTKYDHVAIALKYRHMSKRRCAERVVPFDYNLLSQDPPNHTRIRSRVIRAFTSDRIVSLEPTITRTADELLDRMVEKRTADFVQEFAALLPAYVIADLLGVPRQDRARFSVWSRSLLSATDATNPDPRAYAFAVESLTQYFRGIVKGGSSASRSDLVDELMDDQDGGRSLSENEVLATLILLLVAGHETTVNMLANSLWTFLRCEAYTDLLRDRSGLVGALEEALRYESPVQRATFRVLTEPLEVGGVVIEKGQQVSAIIGAANRDPYHFVEPDRFDIRRTPNRHIAFGLGIHACLGPALSRIEAKISFEKLLSAAPNLELVNTMADWNTSTSATRGMRTLKVRF
ncbi:cytochrome P450 (plasmid) [Burkholderia sp. M6-3]